MQYSVDGSARDEGAVERRRSARRSSTVGPCFASRHGPAVTLRTASANEKPCVVERVSVVRSRLMRWGTPRRVTPRAWRSPRSSQSSRHAAYQPSTRAYRPVRSPQAAGRTLTRLARTRASSSTSACACGNERPAGAERAEKEKKLGPDGGGKCTGGLDRAGGAYSARADTQGGKRVSRWESCAGESMCAGMGRVREVRMMWP
jgi:hypothetical protein